MKICPARLEKLLVEAGVKVEGDIFWPSQEVLNSIYPGFKGGFSVRSLCEVINFYGIHTIDLELESFLRSIGCRVE